MKLQRYALPILLAAFVALALAYSVIVPLGEAPDEVSHWAYVQSVAMHWELPKPEGAVLGEAHQPPLYYFLGALATFWIPQSEFTPIANPDFAFDEPQTPNLLLHTRSEGFPYHDTPLAWHFFRLFSIAMGAVTVGATWRIARAFLPNDSGIALGAAAFIAFLPAFTSLSAVVNNDNLVVMLASLGTLQILRIARRPLGVRDSVMLGILLGLAPLAKLSGLVMWLFAAAILAWLAWQKHEL